MYNLSNKFQFCKTLHNHQFYHRNQSFVVFACLYQNCGRQFFKYKNFISHTYRCHANYNNILSNTVHTCKLKSCFFISKDKKEFQNHVICDIRDCVFIQCPFLDICNVNIFFKKRTQLRTQFFRKHYVGQTTCETKNNGISVCENSFLNSEDSIKV